MVTDYWDEHWSVNKPTARYYYEGQMGIEEDYTREIEESMETDVTRYGLGARGIDFLEVDAYNASPLAKVPLYDGHGNMIATLTKGSGGTYQVSARRYTAPWGSICAALEVAGKYIAPAAIAAGARSVVMIAEMVSMDVYLEAAFVAI